MRAPTRSTTAPGGNCPSQPFSNGVWPICSPAWYTGGANPTYTGPGAEPVTGSYCEGNTCEFVTANGDRFTISLPVGFVVQYQGTAAGIVNNPVVVAAVVKDLSPAKYAEGGASGVPPDLTVSPSYAALLATVGIAPTQFLDWQLGNVPPDQRAPWVPGSAYVALVNGVGVAAAPASTPPASSSAPAPSGGAASKPRTAPAASAATTTKAAPASTPNVYPSNTVPLSPAQRSADASAEVASSTPGAPLPPPPLSSTVSSGGVIANPPDCPRGESAVVEPQGARCLPTTTLVAPPLPVTPHPWAWVGALGRFMQANWIFFVCGLVAAGCIAVMPGLLRKHHAGG